MLYDIPPILAPGVDLFGYGRGAIDLNMMEDMRLERSLLSSHVLLSYENVSALCTVGKNDL